VCSDKVELGYAKHFVPVPPCEINASFYFFMSQVIKKPVGLAGNMPFRGILPYHRKYPGPFGTGGEPHFKGKYPRKTLQPELNRSEKLGFNYKHI
jgi:hypothetical protein